MIVLHRSYWSTPFVDMCTYDDLLKMRFLRKMFSQLVYARFYFWRFMWTIKYVKQYQEGYFKCVLFVLDI